MADDLTPHGEVLERARGKMSKREAARRADISEGRWRQIVTGIQKHGGGVTTEVRPRRETLIAMAVAVGADVGEVLGRAGFEPEAPAEPRSATRLEEERQRYRDVVMSSSLSDRDKRLLLVQFETMITEAPDPPPPSEQTRRGA